MDKRAYNRKYHLERYHRLRAESIQSLGGKCVQCGSGELLEIDHIDPNTKEITLSKIWGVSQEKREAELKKCQILCKTCHKEKSDKEQTTRVHGTPAMYRRGACRCEPCRRGNSEYLKEWKRKRMEAKEGSNPS